MANVPYKVTLKTGATATEIADHGIVFGGLDVVSGTLGTVTVTVAGATLAAVNVAGGDLTAGSIPILKTDKGVALSDLTITGSSAMNILVYWRDQASG